MKLLLLCTLVASVYSSSWNYDLTDTHNGPAHWKDTYPTCGGNNQSPIDISDSTDIEYPKFNLAGYGSVAATLKNTGHNVQVDVTSGNPTLSGGGLNGNYELKQLHFHWGSNDDQGSEHKISGNQAPMEVHFVHAKNSGDLAVLSWLFESGDNSNYKKITDKLGAVTEEGNSVSLGNLDITKFMRDDVGTKGVNFYRYQGSLTTPGCNEIVTWTVFKDKIKISDTQLTEFRKVKDEHHDHISDNFRPVQDLNSRTIYHNTD